MGFYDWKDRYVTTEVINDGGSKNITIYFTDGTIKSTYIYFENPPEYQNIMSAFTDYLGATLYFEHH